MDPVERPEDVEVRRAACGMRPRVTKMGLDVGGSACADGPFTVEGGRADEGSCISSLSLPLPLP